MRLKASGMKSKVTGTPLTFVGMLHELTGMTTNLSGTPLKVTGKRSKLEDNEENWLKLMDY